VIEITNGVIKFQLSTHGTTGEPMVEVWRGDTFVASIYGHEEGVRLVSKHFDGVAYDPDFPPAVVIRLSDKVGEL